MEFAAQAVVLLFGIVLSVLAVWGISQPLRFREAISTVIEKRSGFYLAIGTRLLLGAALMTAASFSRFPRTFSVFGWIAIVAAVVLFLIGRRRFRDFAAWWLRKFSDPFMRVWLLAAVAFGAFLIYGVATPN